MKVTVSVIYYKYKVLANGEFPLMVRIAKDGKRTMKSLGISVNPVYWDFDKNQPIGSCSQCLFILAGSFGGRHLTFF